MTELWELVDAEGAPTGILHERGIPVPDGCFHVVVGVCVYLPDGRVLMSQRAATKDWPLDWEFPAGSALAGETSVQAARRELSEETGVDLAADCFVLVERFREESALFDFYIAPAPAGTALTPDPDEVAASEWVTREIVETRWRDGEMAGPWNARLSTMWPKALTMMDAVP